MRTATGCSGRCTTPTTRSRTSCCGPGADCRGSMTAGRSARETAGMLDTAATSVHSATQRARQTIRARLPGQSQQQAMRSLGDRGLRRLAQRLADALEAGQVEAIAAMLAEDAIFAMPPYPDWCRGRDAVSRSWLIPAGSPAGLRCPPARASGQLALGAYKLDPRQGRYLPVA